MLALCTAVTLRRPCAARVVEGEAHDALAGGAGDDLDGLGGVGAHHVLDAGVEVLGVLAHDHQVDALVAAPHPLDGARRAQAGVEVELLAQGDVDAAKAGADRGGDGPLDGDLVAPHRLQDGLGERRAVLLHDVEPGLPALPLDRHTGGFDDRDQGVGELGPGAVAGDQGHAVGHGAPSLAMNAPEPVASSRDDGCADALQPYTARAGGSKRVRDRGLRGRERQPSFSRSRRADRVAVATRSAPPGPGTCCRAPATRRGAPPASSW